MTAERDSLAQPLEAEPIDAGRIDNERIGAAPAAWGICEVPGWGYQIPADRVLSEMHAAGYRATELGPDGFLVGGPATQQTTLQAHGLRAIGAFCPLVLHRSFDRIEPVVLEALDRFSVMGATMLVIAADTGLTGYDARPSLSEDQWRQLLENLTRIAEIAAERDVTACLHPHIGTQVESPRDVDRVLDGCDVQLCLDTGHLLVGGTDPVQLAHDAAARIAHVHIKDVDQEILARLRSSHDTYSEAVRAGLYTVLGRGSIDLGQLVTSLESSGYRGWYVPELDRMFPGDPGRGGPFRDVEESTRYLQSLLQRARLNAQ